MAHFDVRRRVNVSLLFACLIVALVSFQAQAANIARFDTVLGTFDVLLYEDVAPITVQNFTNYVNDGDYNNSFFHRLVDSFVLQGGGFALYPNGSGGEYIGQIPTDGPIQNEFNVSNTRGTIAMAKVGGDPNSATSQWFFNLGDNTGNDPNAPFYDPDLGYDPNGLDYQNGGFTVFGEVIGNGMDVVDLLASQTPEDLSKELSPVFSQIPLIDYSAPLRREHLEIINGITIITPEPVSLSLMALGGLTLLRRKKKI